MTIGDIPGPTLTAWGTATGRPRVRRSIDARDDAVVTGPLDALRQPRGRDRVIAGVASGWADRWGVEPTVVRAAVGLLTLAGGLGAVLYGVAAIASTTSLPETPPRAAGPDRWRRELAIGCATGAILVAARAIGLWPGDGIMLPAAAVAIGIAVVWSVRPGPTLGGWTLRLVQIVAGIVLLGAGVGSLASRTGGLGALGASASAIAVVVGGLAIFVAPALGRLLRRLDDERDARIREDERARVAAHLHDSVLQSLVLIQRTEDPRRMAGLARRQERELRAWLYGGAPLGAPASLHAAIDAMAVAVESDHDVRVEAIVVGDQPLDDASRALVAAIREAVVNAARHAGVDRVDVFVEADSGELAGFVRDTGCGFDPGAVAADRRGISESIVGPRPTPRRHGAADVTSRRRDGDRGPGAAGAAVTVRVVLVDDHALFRAGVRAELLAAGPDIEIVGEAADVGGGGGGDPVEPARRRPARRPPARRRRAAGDRRRPRRPRPAAVPRPVGLRLGRGRHRRRARRCSRLRHQDDRRRRAGRRRRARPGRRRRVLAAAGRASSSTPSPATSRRRPTPSSTSSRAASRRCCA